MDVPIFTMERYPYWAKLIFLKYAASGGQRPSTHKTGEDYDNIEADDAADRRRQRQEPTEVPTSFNTDRYYCTTSSKY
eukprot:1199868-Pleurochrysis_carterae.AAC.2